MIARPIIIECAAQPTRLYWRWTCRCGQHGEWTISLNDAERQSYAHNRLAHERKAVA